MRRKAGCYVRQVKQVRDQENLSSVIKCRGVPVMTGSHENQVLELA